MGGDHGPSVVMPALAKVAKRRPDINFIVFGRTDAVKPELDEKIKRPYSTVVWKHWWKGDLAISRQSIDMAGNPPKGPKQAWNLGQKAGLPGHASLVPLYLWWALCAWWLVRALRRTPS